jgi:hypothetical protein
LHGFPLSEESKSLKAGKKAVRSSQSRADRVNPPFPLFPQRLFWAFFLPFTPATQASAIEAKGTDCSYTLPDPWEHFTNGSLATLDESVMKQKVTGAFISPCLRS